MCGAGYTDALQQLFGRFVVWILRDEFATYELLAYLSYRAPRLGYRCVELPTVREYPRGEAIPTKIASFSGEAGLLKTLIKTCLGGFNPKDA